MGLIYNGVLVLSSDLFLVIRRMLGCRVKFPLLSIVSPMSSLKTRNKGSISLGKKTCIRSNSEVSTNQGIISLGNNCFVNKNCMIIAHEKIVIEDNVTIGPNTVIYDHDHDGNGEYLTNPVHIGKNVWIGAGCIILKGTTIGENTVVGAGSIITKDIPPNTRFYQKRENVNSILKGDNDGKEKNNNSYRE